MCLLRGTDWIFIYRSLTLNNSMFSPHSVFICFVWISEQTAIISLYINWLVFITETECVYCAVRTGYLNMIQVKITFQSFNKCSGVGLKCPAVHRWGLADYTDICGSLRSFWNDVSQKYSDWAPDTASPIGKNGVSFIAFLPTVPSDTARSVCRPSAAASRKVWNYLLVDTAWHPTTLAP